MLKKFLIITSLIILLLSGYIYFLHAEPYIDLPKKTETIDTSVLHFEENIPIAYIEGIGYQAGLQHGTLLKSQIQEVISILHSEVLESHTLKGKGVHTYLLYKAKELDKYIPEVYRQEMKGISDGADVSYNDILLINTYDDLLYLAGCSSLAVTQKGDTPLIHARNLDYGIDLLAGKSVILHYKEQEFISVGFPGYMGVLSGTNFDGISLSTHTSVMKDNEIGTPSGIIYRQIMEESKTLDEVESILKNAKRTIGNNLIISSALENQTALFEITANNLHRTDNHGFSVATNHFISEKMSSLNNATPNSLKRYHYLFENGESGKNIDAKKMKEIMSFYNGDLRGWSSVANIGTVQSVIFVPEKRIIYVAKGSITPVTQDGYIEYRY